MDLNSDRTTSTASADSWRVKVDRAWRSVDMRRRFENENGVSAVDETSSTQIESGEVASYYDQFVAWAIKTLGVGEQVPVYARPD